MIYAASMVLLNSARHHSPAPRLAYLALGLGISATVAVNVTAGLAFGVVGAIVAAWPAPALVISYELLMVVIRSAGPGPDTPDGYATPEREHDNLPVRPAPPAPVSAGPERRALPGSPGARTIRHGKTATRRMPAADREAAVLAAVTAQPDISHAELARRMAVDEATIRRVRKPAHAGRRACRCRCFQREGSARLAICARSSAPLALRWRGALFAQASQPVPSRSARRCPNRFPAATVAVRPSPRHRTA
jgi:hypothetical protein